MGDTRRLAAGVSAVVAVLAGALLGEVPALGHPADSQVRTVIDTIDPPMDGVTVRVEAGVATQLVVENPTDADVVILGRTGEPFLRIGPDGVWGNRNDSEYYATATPAGGLAGPADGGGSPDWQLLSREPAWGWFDHRLHPVDLNTPSDLDPGAGPVPFADWQVPMRHDNRDVTVSGHLEYAIAPGVVIATLTGGEEPLPGVTVGVSQGQVPAILLDNATNEDVIVFGAMGEPFLRIGSDGVFGNRLSASLADDQRHRGEPVPGPVDAAAPPDWIQLAAEPRYAWLETRARYPLEQPPADLIAAGRPTHLLDWSVPLEQAGNRTVVTGETAWMTNDDAFARLGIPVTDTNGDGGDVPWPSLVALALGAVLLGVGLYHRARNRRSPRQGTSSSSPTG